MNRQMVRSVVSVVFRSLLIACSGALMAFAYADPEVTQVVMDGIPSEWSQYALLLSDPQGDYSTPGFDVADVRAFANDRYLYVLIETHGPREGYVQLDIEVEAGGRSFVLSFRPELGTTAFMGEITSGFVSLGEVAGSSSAASEAVELRVPLSTFEDTSNLRLRNVRPMAGECCGADWKALDQVRPVAVSRVNELEPIAEAVTVPRVCADEIAPPAPFGTLEPALAVQFYQPGYAAEWFVAPGVFNMPQEVFVAPNGDLLVLSVRNQTILRVDGNGTVSTWVENVSGYVGDMDDQGNLYLFWHPDGRISHVSPEGEVAIIAESQELQALCDSGFGLGPDGNLYIALNRCGAQSDLYRITTSGDFTRLATVPKLQSLRTAPDGRFLAASCSEVFSLSLDDYTLTPLGRIPDSECVSPSGMTVDTAGVIYLATGDRKPRGKVYRLDPEGSVTMLAEIPFNGLSGIEWLPRTGEIVGGQLRQGGLVGVKLDGTLRDIVPGNGIITPMGIGFSPCGDLAVPNDDGGMMALVDPSGSVTWFMDYLSFTPPIPFVAFASDGTLYASEAAPGLFPVRVAMTPSGGTTRTLINADYPSGLAYRSDGVLLVSETGAGRILQVNANGATSVLVDELEFPQALALDAAGNLFAIVGGRPTAAQFPTPAQGDAIVSIERTGKLTVVTELPDVTALAISPQGTLFATVRGEIVQVAGNGTVTRFADGLRELRGIAFDIAGNLYVSDASLNGIARLGGFEHGTLEGTVTDSSGRPIEGARIQIHRVSPTVTGLVVTTDENGQFHLPAAPATYTITVTARDFEMTTVTGVTVTANAAIPLSFSLEE